MSALRGFLRENGRMLGLLAMLVLVPVLLGGTAYFFLREAARADTQDKLKGIANLKAEQIEAWLEDYREKTRALAQGPQFVVGLQDVLAAGQAGNLDRIDQFQARNDFLRGIYRFRSVLLLDGQGHVLLGSGDPDPPDDLARLADESRTPGVHLYDFALEKGAKDEPRIELGFFNRIDLADPAPDVILYARIDPTDFLFSLIQHWPTDSASAETLLVRREGDRVLYLNDLRHRPGTSLRLALPLADPEVPAVQAVQGHVGILEGVDYRDEPVLAYTRGVANSPWAMVAKIDRREAYGTVNRLTLITIGLGAVSMAGATLTFLRWRRSERREAELERQILANHFDYLSKYANDGILLADAEQRIVEINDRILDLYGYTREEILGMRIDDLRTEEERPKLARQWQKLRQLDSLVFETTQRRRDGGTFPAESSMRIIHREGRMFFQDIIRDITERNAAQKRIERLGQLYRLLYRVNDAIIQARNPADVFREACRLIRDEGGFSLVWLGAKDPGSGLVEPVAHAAAPGYPAELVLSAKSQMLRGQGPTGIALRLGRPYVCNDVDTDPNIHLWRSQGGSENVRAWGAFPMECEEGMCGVLSVCADQTHAFDHETVELLGKLAASLGLALDRFELERQREEANASLRDNAEQLRLKAQVIEHCAEGIMITDPDNRIVSVNPAFTEITGYTADEVVGRNPRLLQSDRHDRAFYAGVWNAIATTGVWRGEVWNRHKDGRFFPEWLSISTVRDEAGTVQQHIAIFTDITEQKLAEKRIRRLAYYDSLTNLPNRAFFQERLAAAITQAARHPRPLAVFVLDLDHFKHVNDSLGHLVGDAVLREAAKRMSGSIREQDTVARPGGDEFMLILPDTDAEGAAHTAEKIVKRLAEPMRLDGHELHISCSLGISLYPDNGRDGATLLQKADVAMYRAKRRGRNAYQFFTDEMHREAERVLTLEQGLRLALERDEFVLHYQPQVDIPTGQLIGYEALLRWRHPERGLVPPDGFIPVAEESGLILDIGLWVLRRAASQINAWEKTGVPTVPTAINLSAVQFRRDHRQCVLGDQVAMVLEESGIAPGRLELEITETALMEDIKQTSATLSRLREMGVRLAIDDFGTGYSSLSYLKHFHVDRLKIDQSFVRDIAVAPENEAIIDAVICLGGHLGMEVIAEGVETEQQLDRLREKSCGQAQGYYFSRPLPVGELERWRPRANPPC